MTQATLYIDTDAICTNWAAMDAKSASHVETGAVVKADGYGLDAGRVAKVLADGGVRTFFVAEANEGIAVRKTVGNIPEIYVFSGMMLSDAATLNSYNLIPLLNTPEQFTRFRAQLPDAQFGVQLDTGMKRLGMEADEFAPLRIEAVNARLIISHLACADEPDHAQNAAQLAAFHGVSDGLGVRRSLAATGGVMLGSDYHFDLCRPGIGLYGGAPFDDAVPVVRLQIPVIQSRLVQKGESVGYGASWIAPRNSRVATIAAGYADGLIRAASNGGVKVFADGVPCPVIGRVSMDLITVDVTALDRVPETVEILNAVQTVDDLAAHAGTIGYEILTSLGARYAREYL